MSYENIGQIIQRRQYFNRTGKRTYPKHLRWDGITKLFNEKNGTFPSGLVSQVREIMTQCNIEWIESVDYKIDEPTPFDLACDFKVWKHQRDAIEEIKKHKRGMIRIGTGGGKALCLDTPVLTTTGYKQMRDIKLSDEVITPWGKSKIVGIYPQGVQDVYRITFSDGTFAKSTLDHLWSVRSSKDKYKGKPFKVKSLENILNSGLSRVNCENSSQHFIPITEPINSFESSKELPIDPYLLGVLIGDGTLSHGVQFTTIDDEIVTSVENLLPSNMKVRRIKGTISYGISNINPNSQKKNPVTEYLKSVKLNCKSEFKFVPSEYMFNSIENRVALLQGLLDTDGGVEMGRKISFSTSSYQLAKDVQFLVQSLGGTAKICPRETTHLVSYRMNLCLPNEIEPFRLSRKANKVPKRIKYFPRRSIKKVEYVGREEVQCIKIADPNGLFLINDCIVTHNTIMSIVATAEIGQLPVLFVVNRVSLLKQAHADYEKFLGIKIGFIGDGRMEFGKVNIATVHTICSILKIEHESEDDDENVNYTEQQIKMLKLLLKVCKMVIIDECHHASSDMYVKLMQELPSATYRIGLSATPFRTDGTTLLLNAAFGETLYTKPASELIQEGVLAKPYVSFVDFDDEALTKEFPYLTPAQEAELRRRKIKLPRKAQYNTVYKNCVVENSVFNQKVAKIALVNAKMKRLTLVSVKQVLHGENIMSEILAIDPSAKVEFLHGKNKDVLDEDKVKADFAAHRIQILISTLFDEGVDIPAIDVAIDAGGGKSPVKTLQLVGRAMRKYPGKTKAYIYVFIQRYTHLYNHSLERLKILQTEPEFEIETVKL